MRTRVSYAILLGAILMATGCRALRGSPETGGDPSILMEAQSVRVADEGLSRYPEVARLGRCGRCVPVSDARARELQVAWRDDKTVRTLWLPSIVTSSGNEATVFVGETIGDPRALPDEGYIDLGDELRATLQVVGAKYVDVDLHQFHRAIRGGGASGPLPPDVQESRVDARFDVEDRGAVLVLAPDRSGEPGGVHVTLLRFTILGG